MTQSSLPSIAPGYVLAGCFLFVESMEGLVDPNLDWREVTPLSLAIGIVAIAYLVYCVYRIHRVLREASGGAYPIGPAKGAGLLLIPFFQFYWVFPMTNRMAEYVNAKAASVLIAKPWPGVAMLLGMLLTKLDGAVGLALIFGALHYLRNKIRRVEGV